MRRLNLKKLLLGVAGLVAVVALIAFGQVKATQNQGEPQTENKTFIAPVFEVASIKPNKSGSLRIRISFAPDNLRFTATNITTQFLIQTAFGVEDKNRISGEPKWFNSERYDYEAKADNSIADEIRKLSQDQVKLLRQHMLQVLLADRFKLTIHHETKELPVYSLVEAKPGKLNEHKEECDPRSNLPPSIPVPSKQPNVACGEFNAGDGLFAGQKVPVTLLADVLSHLMGQTVLDKTGLTEKYDVNLEWTPERQFPVAPGDASNGLPFPPRY